MNRPAIHLLSVHMSDGMIKKERDITYYNNEIVMYVYGV